MWTAITRDEAKVHCRDQDGLSTFRADNVFGEFRRFVIGMVAHKYKDDKTGPYMQLPMTDAARKVVRCGL